MEDDELPEQASDIIRENEEGLQRLAEEKEAEESRENRLKRKLKILYRRYVKKPAAEPATV